MLYANLCICGFAIFSDNNVCDAAVMGVVDMPFCSPVQSGLITDTESS
jgi:hypothetical protein